MTLGERIKYVRKTNGMTLEKFGEKIGIGASSLSAIETGKTNPAETTIRSIINECGVNEFWLRNGKGDMHASKTRAVELDEFVDSVLHDRPDSFRSALVDTLVRFKPEEWELLEKIFDSIQEKREKKTDEE